MIDENIITEAAGTLAEEDRTKPVAVAGSALSMDVWLKQLHQAQPQADYLPNWQKLNLI